MQDWLIAKLNQLINTARDCENPLLEAHLRLGRSAVERHFDDGREANAEIMLSQLLPLMIAQAAIDGRDEIHAHLSNALDALEHDRNDFGSVVTVDFRKASRGA